MVQGYNAVVAVLRSTLATSELVPPAGVGFVVGERHVLTCAHVVNTALGRDKYSQEAPSENDRLWLRFPLVGTDAIERYAKVIVWYPPAADDRRSQITDVAGLELEGGLPTGVVSVTLSSSEHTREVAVFGYPTDPPRPDGGWVPCQLRGRVGGGLIHIDSDSSAALRAQPGYSGSPLVDQATDLVVGMFSLASVLPGQRDCYAIPAESLRVAMSHVTHVKFKERPAPGPSLWRSSEALAGYRRQAREICPRFLIGRHDELAELADFCAGTEQYAWWQGPPYAGKSNLMAWFISHLPAGLDVVPFFVVSQLPGQANSEACVDALTKQLMVLLGEPLRNDESTAVQRSLLESRIQDATELSVAAGRRLLLIVEGISEDRGAANQLPSIASLLPLRPPDGLHVLVTSRPLLRIPDDVHEEHSLRGLKPRFLVASRHAGAKEQRARQEIEYLKDDDPFQCEVLGFIVAAGGLTESELEEVTGRSRREITRLVDSALGHSLAGDIGPHVSAFKEPVLMLADENIHEAAIQLYGRTLKNYRARVQDWANTYRLAGWPDSTPRYILRDYPTMLAHSGDVSELIECAIDAARHDRMLSFTGSDVLALAEIEQAQEMHDTHSGFDPERQKKIDIERARIIRRSGLTTADEIRQRFQITWSIAEERIHDLLPPPISLGSAGHAWHRSDVERLVRLPESTPERCTVEITGLTAARPPLERRNDLCINFCRTRVHVRVWGGSAEESHRLVVLIGALHDQMNLIVNRIEELATIIDYRLLGGRGATAAWFDYIHDHRDYNNKHRFSNIVMRNVQPSLTGRFSRRSRIKGLPDREHFAEPRWRPISVTDLERVIGGPVECYPEHSYREPVIEEWKKSAGETIDVEHDPASIRKFLESIAIIEDVSPTDSYAALATNACIVLADEITMRINHLDGAPWDDGTKPPWSLQGERDWPRLFAARLVRTKLTQRDRERIARYPDDSEWPWSAEEFSRRTRLLTQLRNWAVDIGEFGDCPDPGLFSAVERAIGVLYYWISVVNSDLLKEDHPGSRVWGPYNVVGEYDRWYLASIYWQKDFKETPVHRELRTKFYRECRENIRFGKDFWRRLVAFHEGNAGCCGTAQFAVEWPQRPPVGGIPDEAYIVSAKHKAGDRAVYIELPDGRLDLLPRPPDSGCGWNFGYSGSGPGHLEWAISRTFELVDGIDKDHFPSGWIEQQVCHGPKTVLRISVKGIRARYHHST